MKTTPFDGEVTQAYGKVLPTPVKFSGDFEAFENASEVRNASEWPSDKDIVAFVNAQRKANARAKATNEALQAAGIEKPAADDPQVVLRNMIKQLILAKKTPEQARQLAEGVLGYTLIED